MLIHEFIANTLRETRRGLILDGKGEHSSAIELDFPVAIVLSRSQPGEHSLQVPDESSIGANLSRVRISLTIPATKPA